MEQPLRICLYTTSALPLGGGQERVVDALARRFKEMGHDVTVLAPGRGHRSFDASLPYRVVRHPRFISTRHFIGWYARYLRKLHREHPFDIIHCHEIDPAGYLGARCKEAMGVPLVITMHHGGVAAGDLRAMRSGVHQRHQFAVARADALVALSSFMREGYERLGADLRRIVDIPNGVDRATFAAPVLRPATLDAAIHPRRFVLYLGRLRKRKGVDVLIEAFAAAPSAAAFTLVIGGSGTEEAALRQLASRLNISDRVRFLGWVCDDLHIHLLQNAYCTVIPSREPESFGLTILESGAAARPVIASRVRALDEHVIDGGTGLLVEPDSPPALAVALDALLSNPARADAMGAAAFERARSFDWSTIARRHIDLYRRLLSPRA